MIEMGSILNIIHTCYHSQCYKYIVGIYLCKLESGKGPPCKWNDGQLSLTQTQMQYIDIFTRSMHAKSTSNIDRDIESRALYYLWSGSKMRWGALFNKPVEIKSDIKIK